MKKVDYSSLSQLQKSALDGAAKAMETAYNPYSHYYVGAAIYTDSGKLITGSNVENAAYWPTMCAERSAIFRANAMNVRNIVGIAVIARGEEFDTPDVTAPCGGCRQVIYEFSQVAGKNIELILSSTKKDKIVLTTIGELFPLAWGPADIGMDLSKYKAAP